MNSKTMINNFIWRLLERCGAQGVTLIVSVILARLLDPIVYGTVALITVFITILQVFIDSGLGNALIQKKEADDLDFSSVFYFNLFICLLLYIFMFLTAPLISDFFDIADLVSVIRVMSLILIVSGIKNVQQAYVSRNLLFKKFFFATLIGTIGAAICGIWMAYAGFGIWALVFQNLLNVTVDTIVLWIIVNWRPVFQFSFERLKGLFSYGWKLMVSSLLETGYTQLRQLIIGKKYTADNLAYYNYGDKIPSLIITNINTSINSVLFPSMSAEQDDIHRVKMMTKRVIKVSSFLIFPLLTVLAVTAEPLVRLILTEKWLPCVPFVQIFCITYMLYPIHTTNLNAMRSLGYSNIFLKLEIVKKIIGLIILVISVRFGVLVMAYSFLFESIISLVINAWPNKSLINYGLISQIKDMLPNIVITIIMGICVFFLGLLNVPDFLLIFMQIVSGIIIYLLCSVAFHNESYNYFFNIIVGLSKKK